MTEAMSTLRRMCWLFPDRESTRTSATCDAAFWRTYAEVAKDVDLSWDRVTPESVTVSALDPRRPEIAVGRRRDLPVLRRMRTADEAARRRRRAAGVHAGQAQARYPAELDRPGAAPDAAGHAAGEHRWADLRHGAAAAGLPGPGPVGRRHGRGDVCRGRRCRGRLTDRRPGQQAGRRASDDSLVDLPALGRRPGDSRRPGVPAADTARTP